MDKVEQKVHKLYGICGWITYLLFLFDNPSKLSPMSWNISCLFVQTVYTQNLAIYLSK